jgi:hypothetical protein
MVPFFSSSLYILFICKEAGKLVAGFGMAWLSRKETEGGGGANHHGFLFSVLFPWSSLDHSLQSCLI